MSGRRRWLRVVDLTPSLVMLRSRHGKLATAGRPTESAITSRARDSRLNCRQRRPYRPHMEHGKEPALLASIDWR